MKVAEPIERAIWVALGPLIPTIQRFLLRTKILSHNGRQPFLLGKLTSMKNLHGFKRHLAKQGFGNHFIAWNDSSQLLSWRKRTDFGHQYHLRIFSDGEVRGHFELTPEAHPIQHFVEKGMQEQREKFFEFFGQWVMPVSEEETLNDLENYHRRHMSRFNEY